MSEEVTNDSVRKKNFSTLNSHPIQLLITAVLEKNNVAEHITSPVTHIVGIQISKQTFVKKWKRARISSILKMTKPESPADY